MSNSQIIFIILLIVSFGFFAYTASKIMRVLRAAKPVNRFDKIGERIIITLLVAFGQTKILRKPLAGLLHALVWWGFLVITIGTIEMIIDGITGSERAFGEAGGFYNVITVSGEIFAVLIIIAVFSFLVRRYIIKPKRFNAYEMKPASKIDATIILILIFILMVSLLLLNTGYVLKNPDHYGSFPVSNIIAPLFAGIDAVATHNLERVNWWIHIVVILLFLNILPYSKHFHVIMAVPNVFFSRLTAFAKLENMDSVTKEVKLMMDPETAFSAPAEGEAELPSFGIQDVNQVSWKNIMDSYTCTECGRCTEVCPANNTGKLLSPRKLYIDLRKRTTEVSPGFIAGLVKENTATTKTLVPDYITPEELWACTTCMACIKECPVDIDHVPFIVEMRRNLVLEQSAVPGELTAMFNNIENNGAPWAFPADDRMKWAEGLDIPTVAEKGQAPEVLFWVGCAGSFDDRARNITISFAKILKKAGIDFAVLGTEESCTGDPAKRAGNEFLFQMQALQNIEVLNMYNVKKIVTTCPHCFNILKNEYPDLGGNYEVMHHSTFLDQLIGEEKLTLNEEFKSISVTYHDSCYLGRGNSIYENPRNIIKSLRADIREMKRSRSKGMCCGAGGAQMFKEEEKGKMRVNTLRTEQAKETGAEMIASSCPFCMTMLTDGIKTKKADIKIYDIAELVERSLQHE